jgi:flagellar motor switch protein FliG
MASAAPAPASAVPAGAAVPPASAGGAPTAPGTAPAAAAGPLSGAQKAAILMLLLGEEQAADLLRHLTPREVQTLGSAMFSVTDVRQEQVDAVLDEFIAVARAMTGVGLGAETYVREVFTRALGEDRAASVLARITPSESNQGIEVLQWMDARAIAELVGAEHPQIIAAVLSYLAPELAADVLEQLPEPIQPDVVLRIATLESIPPEAVVELERVLQKQFQASTSMRASMVGGVQTAARIMNFTRSASEQRIIRALFEADEEIGQAIQDKMLTFDHLRTLDDRSLSTLIRAIDGEVLTVALKGTDEKLRARMLAGMTQRARQVVENEMESLGPVRMSDVQEAQKQILAKARELAEAGTIVLAVRSDDFV